LDKAVLLPESVGVLTKTHLEKYIKILMRYSLGWSKDLGPSADGEVPY